VGPLGDVRALDERPTNVLEPEGEHHEYEPRNAHRGLAKRFARTRRAQALGQRLSAARHPRFARVQRAWSPHSPTCVRVRRVRRRPQPPSVRLAGAGGVASAAACTRRRLTRPGIAAHLGAKRGAGDPRGGAEDAARARQASYNWPAGDVHPPVRGGAGARCNATPKQPEPAVQI